jgi:hypothetical protein
MNRKYLYIIVFVLIIIVILGVTKYFFLIRKPTPIITQKKSNGIQVENQTSTLPSNKQTTTSKQYINPILEKKPTIIIGGVEKQILYPSFSWNPITSTPFSTGIFVTPTSQVKGKKLGYSIVQGQAWQSLVDVSLPNSISEFEKYYADLYASFEATNESGLGISSDVDVGLGSFKLAGYHFMPIVADGPLGRIWGYLFKRGVYEYVNISDFIKDTVQELVLSYHRVNADGSLCEKDNCPYIQFIVFWSDPKSVGDILQDASWNQ